MNNVDGKVKYTVELSQSERAELRQLQTTFEKQLQINSVAVSAIVRALLAELVDDSRSNGQLLQKISDRIRNNLARRRTV